MGKFQKNVYDRVRSRDRIFQFFFFKIYKSLKKKSSFVVDLTKRRNLQKNPKACLFCILRFCGLRKKI